MIDFRRAPDLWRRSDVLVRDLPLALLLAVSSLLPAMHNHGTQLGDLPTRPFDAWAVLVAALECLSLVVRRRWPAVCLTLGSLGFALDQLLAYHTAAGTALPIALMSAGAHLERHRRVTAVLLSLAYVALAVALDRDGSVEGPEGFVTFYLVLVLAWGIGAWLRSTRAAEAEGRRRVAEATRAAERTRIARELHDVVTHHVTAMVVQAEAARYLTAAPDRLDAALSAVTDTGRRAISDLRHLLDLLNPDHDTDVRMPSLGELRTLVEQTRQAGQPVEFAEEGRPADSAGSAEFVAYRVVQESLTNALKYAHGSHTEVRVRYGEKEIFVEVSTDGSGSRAGSPGGSGRGLAGLRERVGALGGEFSADRRAGGAFVVRARIPVGSPA
ncbi:histidine kinase [Microbispora sp. NBRC 16548]|uniref:sensor histidine kinase n=1 Tax=Microbispora sp. NBRC 16548 TaxID=3030994 RepID=UPI0024A11F74|nr:histidine kinase [Microbispora sp. NBRC 16548]GLX11531.1 two-component sensor histidine kinase [Microbispora sp. NBRC 16548]